MHESTPEQRLARSVEKLTRPYTVEHLQRVPGGGRRIVHSQHDPLIGMLRTASLSSTGAHAIGGVQSRAVVDADAIEKMSELRESITGLWTDLVPDARIPRRNVLAEIALTEWHALFITHRRLGLVVTLDVKYAHELLEWWVHNIEAKFDPVRTIELTAPCPKCGSRWAQIGVGELTARVSALTVTFAGTATSAVASCRACGSTWRGEEGLRQLDKLQRDTPTPYILLPEPPSIRL